MPATPVKTTHRNSKRTTRLTDVRWRGSGHWTDLQGRRICHKCMQDGMHRVARTWIPAPPAQYRQTGATREDVCLYHLEAWWRYVSWERKALYQRMRARYTFRHK